MQFVRCARQIVVYAAFLVAYSAIVALAQARFVPAHYRDGALPQIPLQALGGGEVLLELTVSRTGGVSAVRALRATPPFTETLSQAERGWRFVPAEEGMEPEPGRPGDLKLRKVVDSTVLVAGLFRPPTLNTPTLGEAPTFAFRQPVTMVPKRGSEALDPFAFFRPSIAVSADDRRELDRGQPIARVVRGTDREVAVFAAVQVGIDGDRLVAWTRDIGKLKKARTSGRSVAFRIPRAWRISRASPSTTRICQPSGGVDPAIVTSSWRVRR